MYVWFFLVMMFNVNANRKKQQMRQNGQSSDEFFFQIGRNSNGLKWNFRQIETSSKLTKEIK